MPRADELEPGDRTRNPHTRRIVEVLGVRNYTDSTAIDYRTAIGHLQGTLIVPAHIEMEDCG